MSLCIGIDPVRPCRIDGCKRPSRRGRRICSACEHAIARYGDPHTRGSRRSGHGKGQVLLRELLTVETDECILWPLSTVKGYGYVSVNGKDIGVHQAACEHRHGPAPSAKHEVAHRCGVRRCMNYRHIRWATRAENIADKLIHGTHNRGERNWNNRLTQQMVLRLRKLHALGAGSYADLAKLAGVSVGTVHDCINSKTWTWLKEAA